MKAEIIALLLHEFLMSPFFHFAALVDNDNTVGILDGRKAVGNNQRGASLHEGEYSPLNHLLRCGINAGGRFVEHQDLRVEGHGPRERNQLLFAGGEVIPALSDLFVIPVRQQVYKSVIPTCISN